MTDRPTPDPTALLQRYAPTCATLTRDWDDARPPGLVEQIVGDVEPVRLVPRRPVAHRRRIGARVPILVSAGVFSLAVAMLVAVLVGGIGDGSHGSDAPAGGHSRPFDPPSGLSGQALRKGEYSYRVVEQLNLDDNGKTIENGPNAALIHQYVAVNGGVFVYRSATPDHCPVFRRPKPGFTEPDVAFLAKLPTKVTALTAYLRSHVQGSSSRDEAVFVAVGDMLRTADGLASPRLRAALVAVLSRTDGVYLHRGGRDDAGRSALRLDFVNQRIRPGDVQSLYFDPENFRLLEERESGNGRPNVYTKASPAYDAPAPKNASDPDTLTGPAFVQIMRTEQVVTKLPKLPARCHD